MTQTDKLRKKIATELLKIDEAYGLGDKRHDYLGDADQILKVCKEDGLEFVITHGSYGYEAELEEIEIG